MTRYFFVSFTYFDGAKFGFGNLYFASDGFPSRYWLRAQAKVPEPIILNIQELTQADFVDYIAAEEEEAQP